MRKNIKSTWLWLMLIFIALVVEISLKTVIYFDELFEIILSKDTFWVAAASITAVITLIASLIIFKSETKRRKKEETLKAFEILQEKVFDKNIMKYESTQYREIINALDDSEKEKEYKEITIAMARIEHFSAGINSDIYDIELVNKMAGNLIISKYELLAPIIDYKRNLNDGAQNYKEFQSLVNNIIELRNKKPKKYKQHNYFV